MRIFHECWFRFFFAPVNPDWVRIFSALTAAMVVVNFRLWEPYTGRVLVSGLEPWHDLATTYSYRAALGLTVLAFAAGLRPRLSGAALMILLTPLLLEPVREQSRQVLMVTLFCVTLLAGGVSSRDLPAWPVRLIQFQLSLVYGINALAKLSPAYLSGDVLVAMSMTLPNFIADMTDGFYRCGPLKISAAAAAWSSVIVEAFLATGFWFRPLRWFTAAAGILFHILLMTVIHIGMLDWTSMLLYLAFLMPLVNTPGPKRENL